MYTIDLSHFDQTFGDCQVITSSHGLAKKLGLRFPGVLYVRIDGISINEFRCENREALENCWQNIKAGIITESILLGWYEKDKKMIDKLFSVSIVEK